MKNLKEFKELIERYESITIEDIEEAFKYANPESILTGYGLKSKCLLCISASQKCKNCYFSMDFNYYTCYCLSGNNTETYYNIRQASTPEQLLEAYRARAKHMKTLI